MSKQAVNNLGNGRYELRNFLNVSRAGQNLQFMVKDSNGIVVTDGTSVDDLLKVVLDRIQEMDSQSPAEENDDAIEAIKEALDALADRRRRIAASNQKARAAGMSRNFAAVYGGGCIGSNGGAAVINVTPAAAAVLGAVNAPSILGLLGTITAGTPAAALFDTMSKDGTLPFPGL